MTKNNLNEVVFILIFIGKTSPIHWRYVHEEILEDTEITIFITARIKYLSGSEAQRKLWAWFVFRVEHSRGKRIARNYSRDSVVTHCETAFYDFRSVFLFPHGLRRRSEHERKRRPFPGWNDDKSSSCTGEKSRRIFPLRGRYVERGQDVGECTSEFISDLLPTLIYCSTMSAMQRMRKKRATKLVPKNMKAFWDYCTLRTVRGQRIIAMNWLE